MTEVLRRPVWAIGTVICVAVVLLFVRLGVWQLDRHEERSARNDRIEERLAAEPVPVAADVEEYRPVTVEGEWDDAGTVFVRSRSYRGRPGFHVVTPVVLDGEAVLVNRGWVPDAEAPPVSGAASVEGIARATQERGSFGPRDPREGVLREVARVDVGRIQEQYGHDLLPVYVELQEPATDAPVPVEPPDVEPGPHLGYAGQWFAFAAIGAIGWVILLRRQVP
jgi:surfeit locus 1 family protein